MRIGRWEIQWVAWNHIKFGKDANMEGTFWDIGPFWIGRRR